MQRLHQRIWKTLRRPVFMATKSAMLGLVDHPRGARWGNVVLEPLHITTLNWWKCNGSQNRLCELFRLGKRVEYGRIVWAYFQCSIRYGRRFSPRLHVWDCDRKLWVFHGVGYFDSNSVLDARDLLSLIGMLAPHAQIGWPIDDRTLEERWFDKGRHIENVLDDVIHIKRFQPYQSGPFDLIQLREMVKSFL